MQNTRDIYSDRLIRLALVAGITYLSIQLLLPFFDVLAWGFVLAVALYPTFLWLNQRLGQRSGLAATFITILNLLLIVGTLVILTNNMIESVADLTARIRAGDQVIPMPPSSVSQWPLIGDKLYSTWASASSNLGALLKYSNYIIDASGMLLKKMAVKGIDLLLFIFSVILSGYLMTQGTNFMSVIKKFANRVALDRGSDLIDIMKDTIQSVSRGVIGISLLQSLLFGLLLLAADVPGAGLLTFVTLILCIVQAGPMLITIPVVIWLFFTKNLPFAIIFTILLLAVTVLDSFLKPYILSRGLRTPMIVIFLGVIGGVLLHGLIGVFIGPVILAIFYDLISHWLQAD